MLNIKLNLAKLKSAIRPMNGKNGKIDCLIIPIDLNKLFRGQKGIYIDLVAFDKKEITDKQTHIIKQSFPKEMLEKLSDEEKKAMPILGDVIDWSKTQTNQSEMLSSEPPAGDNFTNDYPDDAPF